MNCPVKKGVRDLVVQEEINYVEVRATTDLTAIVDYVRHISQEIASIKLELRTNTTQASNISAHVLQLDTTLQETSKLIKLTNTIAFFTIASCLLSLVLLVFSALR